MCLNNQIIKYQLDIDLSLFLVDSVHVTVWGIDLTNGMPEQI